MVCLSACLHLFTSAFSHVCMSAFLHVCMFAYLDVCMLPCLHVCTSEGLRVCMFAFLHVCMFTCLHVCISAYLHVCMFIASYQLVYLEQSKPNHEDSKLSIFIFFSGKFSQAIHATLAANHFYIRYNNAFSSHVHKCSVLAAILIHFRYMDTLGHGSPIQLLMLPNFTNLLTSHLDFRTSSSVNKAFCLP